MARVSSSKASGQHKAVAVAKGKLAAARAELMAAEIQFKTWKTKQASVRMEKRVYGA